MYVPFVNLGLCKAVYRPLCTYMYTRVDEVSLRFIVEKQKKIDGIK